MPRPIIPDTYGSLRMRVRFVEKTRPEDRGHKTPCLIWMGNYGRSGYGCEYVPRGVQGRLKETESAHRLSYMSFVGPIPPGLFVCHACDQRDCVNSEHLFLGTNSENMLDAYAKGRVKVVQGENHCCAKLTDQQVREIRAAEGTLEEIGKRYGVSGSYICHLKKRQWRKGVADA